jgi:hypothetical protein
MKRSPTPIVTVSVLDDTDESWPLLVGGLGALSRGEAPRHFRILHPDATEQDTYDETVGALGFDPLHACPEHRETCAGDECCCSESHRVAS